MTVASDQDARDGNAIITMHEVTAANWRAALALGVAPEQQRFIANYAPIAAVGMTKAYVHAGGLIWTPFAFYAQAASMEGEPEPVGFTMLAHHPQRPDTCWIFHFFIDQRYQGRGYGALALERLIAHVQRAHPDCREIHLMTHPENARAQRLYTRAGFQPVGDLIDGEPHYRLALPRAGADPTGQSR